MAKTLTKAAKGREESGELALLRHEVRELSQRLQRIEIALRRPTLHKKARPRSSPLDDVKEAIAATEGLRLPSGNLSAERVAGLYGVSLSQIAEWLGRTRQALAKTPDADSLQEPLAFFERVARLTAAVSVQGFRKWLRMPNNSLDGKSPLEWMARGEHQVVADLVDDMLTGAPG